MKMNRVLASIALGLLCVACQKNESAPSAETAAAEKPPWLTNFAQAEAQARAENKMLLINFTGSDWCPPCIMLEKQVFSKREFAEYATKHLVLLEVDFPRRKQLSAEQRAANAKLAGEYGIEGFPTVIVLDSSGKPLGKFGYVPGLGPDKVIAVLEKARLNE